MRAIEPTLPDALHSAFERIDQPVPHWAGLTPEAPAVCQGGVVWSYARFAEAVARVAAFLTDRGVRPGDRVLVVQENGLAAVTVLLAAARIGAWTVPVNARLAWPEIEAIRGHARPRLTVHTLGVSPDAQAHAERDGAAEAPGLEDLDVAFRVA